LLSALDEALTTPLTLVCAPAGFGKTTLLSTWASQHKAQVAWLSLDELDTSATRFWVSLITALRRCGRYVPGLGGTAVTLLQSPQPPPLSACLSALLHELESREEHSAPLMLMVDDYQVIEDPAIHQSLAFFLEHLPAHLHMVLSSRVDPDLPLSRLRVGGHLTEIRAEELRFGEGEASQYLGQLLSPMLSPEEVRKLVSRTEGWIAGLHLAALAMQKREDRAAYLEALTGSQRYLLDYVQEDILAHLSPRVRDFLLQSAILSRLDASVCLAVTAESTRAASQQMLAFLERANLFLVPLDEERHSYRLHDLFREALLSVLHTTQPELVPLLHRRAVSFYEAEGEWAEAITHALQAADFSTAARLIERTVEQFWLCGEAATMARWVLALPGVLVREHARLLLSTALYLLNTVLQTTREQRERRYQEARQLMARVETSLQAQTDESSFQTSAIDADAGDVGREADAAEHALLKFRLGLLRRFMAVIQATASGEFKRLGSMQEEIEEVLDQNEEAIWQTVPLGGSFTIHYTVRREGAQLVPRLLEVKERVSRGASRYANIKVRQWLALSAVRAGQLHLAYEEGQAALHLIEQMKGFALLKGYAEIALAQVYYQWNRLEEARDLLRTVVHNAVAWQQLELLAWGYAELIQVELARRDQSLAQQALHEVEQLVQREHFGIYPRWLPTMQAQWWLAQGRIEAASRWAASVIFPEGAWEGHLYGAFLVVMRVYFARQSFREALDLLEHWSRHLDRPANIEITILFLAQYLVALHQTGESEQAHVIGARLFALTEPEGYLRVYLDEGELMREALEAMLTSHSQPHELPASTTAYVANILAAFEQEEQGANTPLAAATTRKPMLSSAPQASATSLAPDVSLTRREQEVLHLLAAGASNREIAQTLVISLDAVKKHVSNLLGKLGASSRTQAIIRARALSLL
jgi:LuxR family maltose regulon positive regulatory protein